LVAKDLEIADIKNNILKIPSNVRWNTMLDCIEANLNNWYVFMRVCKENRNIIKQEIIADVQNLEIKIQAEEYQSMVKPISVTLDYIQRNETTIADSVIIWKDLFKKLM